MKKITSIALAMVLTLMFSSAAFAMDMGAGHGSMGHGDKAMVTGTVPEGVDMMEKGLTSMKQGMGMMKDSATSAAGMSMMRKEMMPMHKGMSMIETACEGTKHAAEIKTAMKGGNMGMMKMMKGMGAMKTDTATGMSMMTDGIADMDKAMTTVKGFIGM